MASGTQVDLDWAGTDSSADRVRGNATAVQVAAPAAGSAGTQYLTDEEILGIDSPSPNDGYGGQARPESARGSTDTVARVFRGGEVPAGGTKVARAEVDSSGTKTPGSEDPGYSTSAPTEMPAWMQAAAADRQHGGEAQQLWREHQEFRAAFASPDEARAIKELLPGGMRDVLSLREATQSVERIDAALFSGDARAQSEVVAELARANPAAFRSLFAEAARVLAGLGARGHEPGSREAGIYNGSVAAELAAAPALRETGEGWGTRNSEAGGLRLEAGTFNQSDGRGVPSARATDHESGLTTHDSGFAPAQGERVTLRPLQAGSGQASHPSSAAGGLRASQSVVTGHGFDPAAYAAFERSTNDVVARDVRGSISDTLARVLPDGVTDDAARRIGDDIFQEIHRALASDRTLSEQVAAALRDPATAGRWRFGSAEQQQVSSLLAGRARQLVPSVARRVIGEWTSSVLNTSRSRAARQAAAASRVDIAAPGGSLDSMPLRQMPTKEVNYASMTDEQILGI